MVKHTQTIYRRQPTNCLSVFDHFVELALKGLTGSLVAILARSSILDVLQGPEFTFTTRSTKITLHIFFPLK